MTHRVAVVDRDLCQPRKCGLECIKYCPVNKSGADCIAISDESGKARIDEDLCNGCGICVKVCPFDAITIVNLASELSEDKIHQYGQNMFRLYRLPAPKKGQVIGLLGRNGTGKSTIVNILSGSIVPNLGRWDGEPDWDAILEYYSGTELKSHFEDIRDGAIRASIKPQQVGQLAQAWQGTASELLDRYDERGVAQQLTRALGLENAAERSTSELSGGELQRLAVAVACARDADYYFFDEPSSYNDIYQRTAVARAIAGLADSGRAVMVVEHDLMMLDYLSDYIEVLYGQPGSYGIVSGVLSSRVGINAFLDGYLPNENVRFRDKAFSFDVSATADESEHGDIVLEYPRLQKRYDSFSVSAEPGLLRRGQVLGVMGANALGKTTMMKMIAGAIEPDSGRPDKKIKISYKPQYLSSDAGATVIDALDEAGGAPLEGSLAEEQIAEPLGVTRLYHKALSSLSGGELQKVAITACLLKEADLYALDEPSAFLDVEDRIAVAKFLQRFARSYGRSAMVIDHDLQMMDLVSDVMVIFEGEPGRQGAATAPLSKAQAMNRFLASLDVSFRRDERSRRPRINKGGSRLDKQQKESGQFYYG